MASIPLHQFIGTHRAELIRRCRAKVAERSAPQPAEADAARGLPLFLDQLIVELRDGRLVTDEIKDAASRHGRDLLLQGSTVSEVVHDYGDVCQSVTDLAVETNAAISTDDFRTLNRCLDDAIAGAVTAHAREQGAARIGWSNELRKLLDTGITAFEVLQTGRVGVSGRTGFVVHRSLLGARALVDRQDAG